ncbi:MAG: diguanylate cyclase domain-containing protein [Nitrospirota bacterium]
MPVARNTSMTVVALAAAVVVFAIGNYGLGFSQWTVHWWADIAWTLASALTGWKCLDTAKRRQGPYRKAWILFGAACGAWFLGMLYWDYRELVLREVTPFPAFSDVGFMLFAPLCMAGMLWYRAETPTARVTLKQLCNLGIIVSAITISVPVTVIGAMRASPESPLYLAAAVTYPILYLTAFVFGVVCLWLYVWGENRKVFLLLVAGVAVHAATDTLYAAALLGRTYEAGNYLDVYWIAGFALIYAAAATQDAVSADLAGHDRAEEGRRGGELENLVSAATLVVVATVLYVFRANLQGGIVTHVFAFGVIGIAFVGIKEWWGNRVERILQGDLSSSLNALARNEARLAGILEIAPEGIISVDAGQRIVLFNKGAESLFGYSEHEALGHPIDLLIPDRLHAAHRAHVAAFAAAPMTSLRMDERREIAARRKDGTEFPAEGSLSKLILGRDVFFTVVIRDITERRRAAERLQHRLELEQTIAAISARLVNLQSETAHDGIQDAVRTLGEFLGGDRSYAGLFSVDRETIAYTVEWCAEGVQPGSERFNDGSRERFPWFMNTMRKAEIARVPRLSSLPSDAAVEQRAFQEAGVRSALFVPMVHAHSAMGFLAVESVRDETAWTEEDVNLLKVVGEMLTNVLLRRQAEQTLAEQVIRDPLTNLYNRRYFAHRIHESLMLAERNGQCLAVLACDLDHFKRVNDTQGHQAGDQVLKDVAGRVNESIRGGDSAFRWGGDEITILLTNTSKEGVLVAAQRIRDSVRKLKAASESGLDISIGIALYPEHGRTADELVRLADRALYIAKKGGDKIHIGEEEYALKEGTIRVVFQPVQDLRLNEPTGFEALSRDAQGKLSILDLFKKYQAIGLLDDLKRLCFTSQMKTAQAVGLKKVFINVDFKLLGKLQPSPVPTGLDVVLEISEAEALHDVENHLAIAKQWRAYGYKLAIDDFGAGFVSLPFIARLIPEHIKLDRSTVLQAVESTRFRRILKDLLLGLRNCSTEGIIAEGIESAEELEVMRELGIYLVQGYLLGRPKELTPLAESDLPQQSAKNAA